MSENNGNNRNLTRLRVKKHRALMRELANERHNDQDENSEYVEERNPDIAPDRRIIEDSMYRMDTIDIGNCNQSMEILSCGGLTGNIDDDNNHIEEPTASEHDSENESTIDGRSSSAYSNSNHHYDREDADGDHNNEVHEIREWANRSNIPFIHLDDLLKILRKRLLPELPQSSKTFLQTHAARYNIVEMEDCGAESGEFVYIGIAEGLRK